MNEPVLRPAPPWWKKIVLSLVATLVFLLVAEVVVRVAGLGPSRWAHPWHLETEDKRRGLDVYPDDPRDAFEVDLRDEAVRSEIAAYLPEVEERWRETPHGVRFRYSAELCRGGDIGPKRDGVTRIVAIGDSFTEGQGVPEERTWAAQLGARDEAREVLNCGRRGYDFPEIHEFFERQLALEPDVVVYAYTLNDPAQSETFHARQAFLDDWILDRRRMFTEGAGQLSFWEPRLWVLLSDRLEGARVAEDTTRWYREMVGPENGEGWDATVDHIAAMHEAMEARGGRFVVAIWPLFVDLDGDYPFEEVHATVQAALRERGVEVVDSWPRFRGSHAPDLWVHAADRHPNGDAHAIFAELVHGALAR